MDYVGTINALLRAVGFKTTELTRRLLQEKGATEIDTYTIFRFALIPAVIWSLIFVQPDDIAFIIGNPELLTIFGIITVLWNTQALLISFVINSTSSMVHFATLYNIFTLPLFLAFGTFYNGDRPNVLSIAAIGILILALLIKPAHHKTNLRPRLARPLVFIALIILAKAVCDTILDGTAREALKQISPPVFLGVFSVTTLTVCSIISKFYVKPRFAESKIIKEHKWLVLLVPFVWFAASIPEAYAVAALPIYTVISIGAITFAMDIFSDVLHKRIRINFQTLSCITLVLAGISLAVFSI